MPSCLPAPSPSARSPIADGKTLGGVSSRAAGVAIGWVPGGHRRLRHVQCNRAYLRVSPSSHTLVSMEGGGNNVALSRGLQVLAAIPGLAALGAAALYASGAFQEAAELRGAGLVVRDALPLIPLEDLLARGIQTALRAALFVGLSGAVVAVALSKVTQLRPRALREFWTPRTARLGRTTHLPARAYIFFLPTLVLIAVSPPAIGASGVIMGIVNIYGLTQSRRRAPNQTGRVATVTIAAMFAVAVAGLIAQAGVAPSPLALVTLHTVDRGRIAGGLIAVSDNTWYVRTAERRIDGVPLRSVGSLTIASPRPARGKSILELAVGRCLPVPRIFGSPCR